MKVFLHRINVLLVLFAMLCVSRSAVAGARLSSSAKFSVLTCSPGADLYSLFGHSAFRLQDTLSGQPIDVVFNYGTFNAFDDGFYVKFARGKLDYMLQAEYYEYFIASYEEEGRAVWEQELLLSPLQKQRLFDLLQANVKQPNCVYRYDFFYDNCSSRIRDMIIRACAVEPTDVLGFRYVALDSLVRINTVEFASPRSSGTTYRQAIQTYLNYQPWSDFGIDLALGQPCDRVIQEYGFMFLPDSLMRELEFARLNGNALCAPKVLLLPLKLELHANTWMSPIVIMVLWMLIHMAIAVRYRKRANVTARADKFLLALTGVLSLLILFLWFFTNHSATANNWNLLWASPLNLVVLFFYRRKRLVHACAIINLIACALVLTGVFWLPQALHPATLLIAVMLIITNISLYRNARIIEH